MQHIENDMDDLFKRAAENYPLRQGKGDWESIAKRISDKSEGGIIPAKKNNNNKKIIVVFLLLLMLPVSWLIIRHDSTTLSSINKNEIKIGNNKKFLQPVIKNNDELVSTKQEKSDKVSFSDDQVSYHKKGLIKNTRNILIKITSANSSESFNIDNDQQFSAKSEQERAPVVPAGHDNFASGEKIKVENGIMPVDGKATNKVITDKKKEAEELNDRLKKNDSPYISQSNKKQKITGLQKKKGFYIGIVAGPDLSKVQSMGFSNSGITGGLIAGLNVGNRLSLETGVNWNKKYYDSKGSDFNMDKVGATMASGMVIENLASSSSFIEIPVKVKYDVIRNKRSGFFVAGGVSAYIMTKEKNKYNVTMNGTPEKITGTYDKNNYGLPAIANISAGYQHTINARLQIRIEPFLKIPLKGMGVGSLPITSTGLQVGIISRLK